MEVMVKLAAVGVTAVVLSAVLKKNTPELALLLALAAGLWMLAMAAEGMGAVVALMEELAVRQEADSRRQGRAYQALGLSGGAFLVILLL